MTVGSNIVGNAAIGSTVASTGEQRSGVSVGDVGVSAATRRTVRKRTSASEGATGASVSTARVEERRTSVSSGAAGASAASRAVALVRAGASGNGGASSVSRSVALVRVGVSEGATGASASSRSVALVRRGVSSGAAGASAASRLQGTARTSLSAGAAGASAVSRTATVDRLFYIDGQRVEPAASVEVGPQSVRIRSLFGRDLPTAIAQLSRTDDATVESGFGGRFRAVADRPDAAVSVDAPLAFAPAVVDGDRIPVGFSREEIAPDKQDIEIDLQRLSNRDRTLADADVVDTSGTWEIDLARGRLGLDTDQVGQIAADGSPAETVADLSLRLSDREMATLIEAANSPAAVVERSVPDGRNRVVDSTPDGRQTATLSVPTGAQLDGGEWLISDWRCTLTNRQYRAWDVSVTLRRPGD